MTHDSSVARLSARRSRLMTLSVAFAVLATGCADCNESGSGGAGIETGINTPSLNNPLPPAITNNPVLSVTGTRTTNTEVVARIATQDGAEVSVSPSLALVTWSGSLTLAEGENRFTFFARRGDLESPETSEFVTVLDTEPPGAPTLKNPAPPCVSSETYTAEGTVEAGATLQATDSNGEALEVVVNDDGNFSVNVPADGSTVTLTQTDAAGNVSEPLELVVENGLEVPTITEPAFQDNVLITADISVTLRGEKLPGLGVLLRFEGEDTPEFIVEPNGDATWEHTLELRDGDNVFYITGRDIDGEEACAEVQYTITQSSVCPPVITNADTFPELTNNPELPVEGTRCEDVTTFMITGDQNFEDGVEVAAAAEGTDFSFTMTLEEGENTFLFFNRDQTGLISPPAGPFTVELDTIPPNAPIFDPEPPETVSEAVLELRGTKDRDADLCVAPEGVAQCEVLEAVPVSATAFRFDQEMVLGDNTICISSTNLAGNTSEETCAFINRVANNAPTIIIEEPTNGAPIDNGPLGIVATVFDESGLDEVEICFNARTDCQIVESDTDTYRRVITPRNLSNGETYSITVRATNDIGGVAQETVQVLYVIEGIVLSTSAPELIAENARLSIDGEGKVHAIWQDECSQSADCAEADGNLPFDIFHRVYDGAQWSPISVLSNDINDSESEGTAIGTDVNGDVHVIWADNGDIQGSGSDFDLMHRVYDVQNDTWGDITVITTSSEDNDLSPSLGTGGDGSVHVVWERRTNEDGPDDIDVYYAAFNGQSWGDELLISNDAGNNRSVNPQVGADSVGVAYVVWQDNGEILDSDDDQDIFLKTVDGNTRSATTLVTDNALDGDSFLPQIKVGADDIAHIVWEDTATLLGSGDDNDIFYRQYLLNEGFTGNYTLVSNDLNDGYSTEATLTLDPDTGDAFVAWADDGAINDVNPDFDIYYARLFGTIAGQTIIVSGGNAFADFSEFPNLALDPVTDVLHIVWEDDSTVGTDGDDRDIFYLGVQLDE